MKPRLDHLVQRPFTYRTARETLEPGYLEARFRTIRTEQQRRAKQAAAEAMERAAKVRPLAPAPAPAPAQTAKRRSA